MASSALEKQGAADTATKKAIPYALTLLRLFLAPALVLMANAGAAGFWLGLVVLTAFVSDVFDGIIARRLGVATAELRHLDSRVDLVFYATAAWTVWHLYPPVVRSVTVPALVVIGLDVARHVFDVLKFGRDVAYHAWSSKLWGFFLATALMLLLGFGITRPFVWIAVVLGVIAQVEGLAISVVLPRWTHDVPSIVHALRIRNGTLVTGYKSKS